MATYTENYNLEKPAQSDLYNIDVFNENADKIDEALGGKAENQSLAPIESSATASRNYSVGQQFVYNGLLYEATSAIASGGTITPGSNCTRTTVAEELSALNDSLSNIGEYLLTDRIAVSANSSSWTTITTLAIPHGGTYIITGDIDFGSNSTGIRILIIDDSETPTNKAENSVVATGRATLSKARIVSLPSNSTLYLRGYHTAGASMTIEGRIRAVRIK